MDCKNTPNTSYTTSIVYKKKEESGTPLSTPLTLVSLVNNITGETPDPLISTSNNAEMSDTISYNEAQRRCHRSRCKAGQVDSNGKVQHTLTIGETPNPLSCSSNNDEMLKNQYTQQELDEVEKHQAYQKEQEMLMQQSAQILKTVNPDVVTEIDDIEFVTKVCMTCGAIQTVPYNVERCEFVSESAKKHKLRRYEDSSEIFTSKRYDVDTGDEITTFVNIEAEMGLGTRDPEIEQINPYIKTWHYDFRDDLVYGSMKQLYSNKARKSDIEREYETINEQICKLANCLDSDSPRTVGYAKKTFRLIQDIINHDHDGKCDKCFEVEDVKKDIRINSFKNRTKDEWNEFWYHKIIKQHGHYEEYDYPKECGHLSTKQLSDVSWKYQQATRIRNPETGKMMDRTDVDITAVKEVLAVLASHTEYPMLELIPKTGYDDGIQSAIIMFGDVGMKNSRYGLNDSSWQDKGKRSGKDGKVVPAWNHDRMRNQAFQQYNMDYMIEQSENIDGSKMDNGVDGMFDGDIIYTTKVA
jgi:hypothetical protein